MSTRITDPEHVALYDSVTGTAFGPVFDNEEDADAFLRWLEATEDRDPRGIGLSALMSLYEGWYAWYAHRVEEPA